MSNNYYYLVASLPHLRFGDSPPIAAAGFLEECAKWLSAPDFEKLSRVKMGELSVRAGDPALIKEWKAFYRNLREEIAGVRRSRKESAHEKYPPEIKSIFDEPNPLLMEKKFEEKKWFFLEEKESEHHFDLEVLIIYFLKLQILERVETFDAEKGKALFEGLSEVKV
jgi:hypothetical protein